MIYKDFEISAITKSYSLWSLDNEGNLDWQEYEYAENDIIAYTIKREAYDIYAGDYEYETIDEAREAIEVIIKEHKEQKKRVNK